MNAVIETIMKRQSVRLYEQKPVPKDIINTIVKAGNLAPSTGDEKMVEKDGKKTKITNLAVCSGRGPGVQATALPDNRPD